jgi:ribosomal protein L32E
MQGRLLPALSGILELHEKYSKYKRFEKWRTTLVYINNTRKTLKSQTLLKRSIGYR